MFVNMENLVHDIVNHNLQNRTIALVENGSWAPTAGGLMRAEFSKLKNCTILDETVTIKSSLKEAQLESMDALAEAIVDSMPKHEAPVHTADAPVEQNAMFSLSYGLFVLTARDGAKDNGCIINTVTQLTDTPKRISIAVNKANYTHDMIKKTGVFNVSVLSNDAPFANVPALWLPVRPRRRQVRRRAGHGPRDQRCLLSAVLHERLYLGQGHADHRV